MVQPTAQKDFTVANDHGSTPPMTNVRTIKYSGECSAIITSKEGITLTKEDIGNILTFNASGHFQLDYHPMCYNKNVNTHFQFTLTEQHSGLYTEWAINIKDAEVNFMGWEFHNKQTGNGYLRPLLANRIALASALGCTHMQSPFGAVGAYAFARAGFLPENEKEWETLRSKIVIRLEELEYKDAVSPEISEKILTLCLNDNPTTLWEIADLKTPVTLPFSADMRPDTLGKCLLLKNGWNGIFDINNNKQMQRLAQFVGSDVLNKSFQNVREICTARNVAPSLDMAL